MEKTNKINTRQLTLIGVMTAVICVLGPLSLPIGIVPISLTNLAIYFAVYVLGGKRGTLSYIVYLFIGLVGLPVFSGFSGGFSPAHLDRATHAPGVYRQAGRAFGPLGLREIPRRCRRPARFARTRLSGPRRQTHGSAANRHGLGDPPA